MLSYLNQPTKKPTEHLFGIICLGGFNKHNQKYYYSYWLY